MNLTVSELNSLLVFLIFTAFAYEMLNVRTYQTYLDIMYIISQNQLPE